MGSGVHSAIAFVDEIQGLLNRSFSGCSNARAVEAVKAVMSFFMVRSEW